MIAINCPGCGAEAWLTGEARCRECGSVLRRCADCSRYDARRRFCQSFRIDIDADEAKRPTVLTVSALCGGYAPLQQRRAA